MYIHIYTPFLNANVRIQCAGHFVQVGDLPGLGTGPWLAGVAAHLRRVPGAITPASGCQSATPGLSGNQGSYLCGRLLAPGCWNFENVAVVFNWRLTVFGSLRTVCTPLSSVPLGLAEEYLCVTLCF